MNVEGDSSMCSRVQLMLRGGGGEENTACTAKFQMD